MDTGVRVVKAYLELCGYFVLAELPVRKATGSGYRDITDIDIIAVRFPHPSVSNVGLAVNPLDLLLGSDSALRTFEEGVDVIIGEVKEGRAELNPALHRLGAIEFALRRLGCCPPDQVSTQAAAIASGGQHEMNMGGMPCRIRLVIFAGHGTSVMTALSTVPLARCVGFIKRSEWGTRDRRCLGLIGRTRRSPCSLFWPSLVRVGPPPESRSALRGAQLNRVL